MATSHKSIFAGISSAAGRIIRRSDEWARRGPRAMLPMLAIPALISASARAQWTLETVDATQFSTPRVAVAADGTTGVLYSGPTNGFSCDGTAEMFFRVRVAENTWVEPQAAYQPYRLVGTRPHMTMNPAGDVFIAYENRWAYYTMVAKFLRTGPTTWVRDGEPVFVKAPGWVPCGTTDPNIPSTSWLYGYNPKIAVGADGAIHVFANRSGGCAYAYNNGANWRTGWSITFYQPNASGTGIVVDANNDAHLAMVSTYEDPNLGNNLYVKFHQGQPVVGPLEILDNGARTADSSIAVGGTTAYLLSPQWNMDGQGLWNGYLWTINGTIMSQPVKVTNYSSASGFCCIQAAARDGWFRFWWRQDSTDARWIWWLGHLGFPDERMSSPGHDNASWNMVMDSAGNLHAALADWQASGSRIAYAFRLNDEPPPTDPRGTLAGTVRNQFGAVVPNATVTAGGAGITTTGPGGTYSMSVPISNYTVTAAKLHYNTQVVAGVIVNENQTTPLDFTITGLAPGTVTSFTATAGNTINHLKWRTPASANLTGTMVRCKTGAYPTGPTDGSLAVNQAGAPNTEYTFQHAGLTNGTLVYYRAYAYYTDAGTYYAPAAQVSSTPFGPADHDHDGDVDQSDFGHFQLCITGPASPQYDPDCQDVKFDADEDVDLLDFGVFQRCYSGANNPADPDCASS